jgi:hypothetical protein
MNSKLKFTLIAAFLLLPGCQLGQTVIVSKGEAGGFSQIVGGQAEYCKVTTTPGVELSESDRKSFIEFCLKSAK